jgi:3-hydroxyisobutyrate dehydrogenase-like beta-hydroxyacid dehydrogenase
MRAGVIGVGSMGAPVAIALAESHEVSVFDADDVRLEAIASARVGVARSAAALVCASDVVVTVLPGPVETETVIRGVLDDLAPGACWLDLSTGDPRVTRRLADDLAARGIGCVAAPMGGGPAAARARELHFTVAGEPSAVQRVGPLLECLSAPGGADVIGGDPAEAQVVKLLSNLLWFGQVIAVTEAMLLGRAAGIDAASLRGMLAERSGSSVLLVRDYDAVLRGDYLASFGIDRVVEQLATLTSLAAELSVPFELSRLVEGTHRAALAAFGSVPGELLAARLLEERAGFSLGES